jgi:uncharacterized membrane protein
MKNKLSTLLKSRRFWAAAAGLVAVVGQDVFGVELDTEQLVAISTIVVAWIIGDAVRETK